MRGPRLRHRVEYALFRVLQGVLLLLPERVALALGGALGWVAGTVLRVRRKVVDDHLAMAYPGESRSWRARVARASYVHLGREGAVTFRLSALDPAAVVARTTIHGLEAFRSALATGTGVVLATGHMGNWEVGGAAFATRGMPTLAVTKGMANTFFDRALVEARGRLGVSVVDMAQAPPAAVRALRRGWVVGMLADQDAREHGVFVPFFGRPAATFRGPALFALRTGAPIFVGVALREPGWPPRYTLSVERLEVPRTGDLEEDVLALTRAYTARLEGEIRKAPEQYFWHHKRWKTRPPGEAAG